jgi:ABC-type uncharacterized transport system substrate-binding protein
MRFVVITLYFSFFVYENIKKKNVLVLHSYNTDYSWVRDVNEGINRVYKKNRNVNMMYHYMDTKNIPTKEWKIKAGIIAQEIIDILKPDIILSCDDDAQEYALAKYVNRKDVVMVYTGVNAPAEKYNYTTATNVTGMLERLPLEGIKDFIRIIRHQLPISGKVRVSHVADKSTVVLYDDADLHAYKNWGDISFGQSFLSETFDEWKASIVNAKEHMDIMLISNYRKIYKDKNKKELVPFKEVMEWAYQNSPVPIIGVNGFVCEDGAAIAIGTSPFEQGEIAMQMVIDIANKKKKVSEIPIASTKEFIVIIDEKKFHDKFTNMGIKIPKIYEAFARATDKFIPIGGKDEGTKKKFGPR